MVRIVGDLAERAIDGAFDHRRLAQTGALGQAFNLAYDGWIGDLQCHERLHKHLDQRHQYTERIRPSAGPLARAEVHAQTGEVAQPALNFNPQVWGGAMEAPSAVALTQDQPSAINRPVVEWTDRKATTGFDAVDGSRRVGQAKESLPENAL